MPSAEMTSIRCGCGGVVVARTNDSAGDDAGVDPKLGGFTMIRPCRASWLTNPPRQPCVDIPETATIIILPAQRHSGCARYEDKDNGLGCVTSGLSAPWRASRHRRRKPANSGIFFGRSPETRTHFNESASARAAAPLAVTIVDRLPGRTAPAEHAQVIETVPGGCTATRGELGESRRPCLSRTPMRLLAAGTEAQRNDGNI